jgi:hypothetical protein
MQERINMQNRKLIQKIAALIMVVLVLLANPVPTHAIAVTQQVDAIILAQALLARGESCVVIQAATLSGHTLGTATSSGTFTNVSGTYGNIGGDAGGIVLSSGNVSDYGDGPNLFTDQSTFYGPLETPEQKILLDQVTGPADHYDVTRLDLIFDMQAGCDTISVDVTFGSEEYPEFVGSPFVDGLGVFVDDTDLAFVNALPVNINHPAFAAIAGTELDGVLAPGENPVLTFSRFVGAATTGHKLTVIICDTNDEIYDSTAFLAKLRGSLAPAVPTFKRTTR